MSLQLCNVHASYGVFSCKVAKGVWFYGIIVYHSSYMSSKTQQKQTLSTTFMHSFVQLQVKEALPLVETTVKTKT